MADISKVYSRINWVNNMEPAINEDNLNRMDYTIDVLDSRIVEQNTIKMDKTDSYGLIKDWVVDEDTGVITITKVDGSQILFDLNIEKIPVSFELSEDGILTMTTDDGTKFTANIGSMIPVLTFTDSDEIVVSVSGEGKDKTYSFGIKSGSITEDKLQPNFLADVKVEVGKAETFAESSSDSAISSQENAILSESYAHGGTNTREGEDTDNAKYYYEQAKSVSHVDIMTDELNGIGKPDNDTISVDESGTFKANLNKELLDKFSETEEGNLLFDGKPIEGGGGGDGKHRNLPLQEYEELTEEERNDGTIYFINDADTTTDLPSIVTSEMQFSTNEKIVGVWVDGKPLYQISIVVQNILQGDNSVKLDVDYDYIDWSIVSKNNNYSAKNYYNNNSDYFRSYMYHPTKTLNIQTVSDYGGVAYITFRYTKTTDATNSYIYKAEEPITEEQFDNAILEDLEVFE